MSSYLEHHPFITLNDSTEITYSGIKENTDGKPYITLYYETPWTEGFKSMQIDYPDGKPEKIKSYTDNEVKQLLHYYDLHAASAFQFAKED